MSDNYKSETAFDATHRFLFDNTDIRGNLTCLKNSYREILAHQKTPAALLPLLGEFLAAVSLLSETLKFEGTLTLQVRGDGPVPLVVAEATDKGDIRGIMKLRQGDIEAPSVALEQHSFRELLGRGALTITIDPAQGQRYQGIVPLEGETLAECISLYFQQSEQLPTYVWLFADDNDCGGLLLQSLPAQKITDPEQRNELWQTALQLAKTLRREEVSSLHHETLLFRLFHEMNCRVFPARSIQFKCSCTRARSESAIASLGKAEAYELLAEQGKIAIDCQFCGQHYAFKQQDLDKLFGSNGLQ